jgi:hypothetical protein
LTAHCSPALAAAAEEAEAASRGAAEAAAKADAARAACEALTTDAERWMADAVPPGPTGDGAKPGGPQVADAGSAALARTSSTAGKRVLPAPAQPAADLPAAAAAASAAPPAPAQPLLPPARALPRALVGPTHALWRQLESGYLEGLGIAFAAVRRARRLALTQLAGACRGFRAFLARPDGRQALVAAFVERFNAVEPDVRATREAGAELLLRCDELRDALWALCDARADAAEAERQRLAAGAAAGAAAEAVVGAMAALAQVELDRFLTTVQFLQVVWGLKGLWGSGAWGACCLRPGCPGWLAAARGFLSACDAPLLQPRRHSCTAAAACRAAPPPTRARGRRPRPPAPPACSCGRCAPSPPPSSPAAAGTQTQSWRSA